MLHLSSSKVPQLPAGPYEVDVRQTLVSKGGTETPITRDLTSTEKEFTVTCPRFKIDLSEIHSVYPPQGHSALPNTLPHIVFKNATIPWERNPEPDRGIDDSALSQTPWLALLSLTSPELRVDRVGTSQSSTLATTLSVAELKGLRSGGIVSPLSFQSNNADYQDSDTLNVLLLTIDLFKALFGTYSGASTTSTWQQPTIDNFSLLAHVRTVDGGGEYGIVVANRVAPLTSSPQAMLTHLISLEDIGKIILESSDQYVALPTLYAWTWNALPEVRPRYIDALRIVAQNVGPLKQQPISEPLDGDQTDDTLQLATQWLEGRLAEGFTLPEQTLQSGETVTSLLRGALSPIKRNDPPTPPMSLFGTDFQTVDRFTGLMDVSLQSAWELGRNLAIADQVFSTSLLRFRGTVHLKAVQAAQLRIVGSAHNTKSTMAQKLPTVMQTVESAYTATDAVRNKTGLRWNQDWSQLNMRAATKFQIPVMQDLYRNQVEHEVDKMAIGSLTVDLLSNAAMTPPSDWNTILKWILEKLYLKGIPTQYLVPEQSALPPETMRTFYISDYWLESLIDGALSIANHFQEDDDTIRSAIKRNINVYLSTNLTGLARPLQIPRWGFMIRTSAIQVFPDIVVEAPYPSGQDNGWPQLVDRSLPAHDTLVCLLDRIPEDGLLEEIVLSQPYHQPTFSLGTELDWSSGTLTLPIRYIANEQDASTSPGTDTSSKDIVWSRTDPDHARVPIFDWENRTLIGSQFFSTCLQAMLSGPDFSWPNDSAHRSSALTALQLSREMFKMVIKIPVTSEPATRTNPSPYQLRVKPKVSFDEPKGLSTPPNPLNKVINLPATSRLPPAVVENPDLANQAFPPRVPRRELQALTSSIDAWLGFDIRFGPDGGQKPPTNVDLANPIDIVFCLQGPGKGSIPSPYFDIAEILVCIPLSSLLVVVEAGMLNMLDYTPRWAQHHSASWYPTVLPINNSYQWMYDTYVAPTVLPSQGQEDCFCIRIVPWGRPQGALLGTATMDTSFVLRGARTALLHPALVPGLLQGCVMFMQETRTNPGGLTAYAARQIMYNETSGKWLSSNLRI